MANVHCYIGIENINLSAPQRGQLVTALQALGVANSSSQPAQRNHWRARLDNDAVIFEALFNEDNIDIPSIKQFLANVFSVDVSEIDHATQQTAYGLMVTFSRNATNYIRMVSFGYDGAWPQWNDSRLAVLDYLAANSAEWEPEQV